MHRISLHLMAIAHRQACVLHNLGTLAGIAVLPSKGCQYWINLLFISSTVPGEYHNVKQQEGPATRAATLITLLTNRGVTSVTPPPHASPQCVHTQGSFFLPSHARYSSDRTPELPTCCHARRPRMLTMQLPQRANRPTRHV